MNNMKMTLEKAQKAIHAAREKAEEMKIPQNIAVVDAGGNLVAFERMDGAMMVGIEIAIDKAFTSAGTGFRTEDLGPLSQPGSPAYGLALSDKGRVMVFGGGAPIKDGDELIGGIGISGGMAPDDQKIADAGAEAVK